MLNTEYIKPLKNADIFETQKFRGYYKSVGVGGSLTGSTSDMSYKYK